MITGEKQKEDMMGKESGMKEQYEQYINSILKVAGKQVINYIVDVDYDVTREEIPELIKKCSALNRRK